MYSFSQEMAVSALPERGSWKIVCDPSAFEKHRNSTAFHRLLTLGHIVNSLRFAEGAAYDRRNGDDPASTRQRAGAFFYLAGLLDEGLSFAERLGQHFRHLPAYQSGFRKILKDPVVREMRAGMLDRLRNQAVFHNDDIVVESSLPKLRMPAYSFASGKSAQRGDVYYGLADIAFFSFALGDPTPEEDSAAKLADALTAVIRLSGRFATAADTLIGEALQSSGWRLVSVDP